MGRDPGPGGRGRAGGQAGGGAVVGRGGGGGTVRREGGGHARGLMVHAVLVLGITIIAASAQTCLLRAAAAGQAMEA